MSNIEVEHWNSGRIKILEIYNDKNELHNTEGPAVQFWHANGQEARREFFINGYFNNTEGPAVIGWDENGRETFRVYYINDVEYTEEEFYRPKDTVEVSAEGGKTVRISRRIARALNLI